MRTAALIVCLLPLLAVAQPVVPGFDRFPHQTPTEQVAAGEVLINELNCIGCHAADKSQSHRFETRAAPVLFTTHNSASASWLRHWLNDPHDFKPGTIMPDLLHGLTEKAKARAVDGFIKFFACTGTAGCLHRLAQWRSKGHQIMSQGIDCARLGLLGKTVQ